MSSWTLLLEASDDWMLLLLDVSFLSFSVTWLDFMKWRKTGCLRFSIWIQSMLVQNQVWEGCSFSWKKWGCLTDLHCKKIIRICFSLSHTSFDLSNHGRRHHQLLARLWGKSQCQDLQDSESHDVSGAGDHLIRHTNFSHKLESINSDRIYL